MLSVKHRLEEISTTGNSAGFKYGIETALAIVNDEIAKEVKYIKDALHDNENYKNFDWSKMTNDEIYIIGIEAESDAIDGDEYITNLIDIIEYEE